MHNFDGSVEYMVTPSGPCPVQSTPLGRHSFQPRICGHRLFVAHFGTAFHISLQSVGARLVYKAESAVLCYISGS